MWTIRSRDMQYTMYVLCDMEDTRCQTHYRLPAARLGVRHWAT